jgi:hypothetical protein
MGLLVSFDESADFWKMYPQMKTVEPFKTSFKKKMPSAHMWAIAFLCDPSEDNVYRNIPEEEKMEVLAKDFLEEEDFDWEQYEEHIHRYKQMVLSQAERSLITWNETMALRDREVKKLYKMALSKGDIENVVTLDRLLANTPKFYADYEKIARAYKEELNKKGKGDRIKSLSSSNEI